MHSGTRRRLLLAGLRIAATAVAAAVVVGLTPAVAEATPRRPSDSQIAAAKAAADAVTERIGGLSAQLTAAEESVEAARAAALIALDEYQATEAAAEAAQQRADAAQAAVARADADLGVARDDVADFARRSYIDGSTWSGAAALITAADPAQLIERAALLEAAGSHRSDVLVQVTVVQERATAAEEVAHTALVEVTVLKERAASTLAVAQTAEVSARQQAAELATEQEALETQLVAAQAELRELVGARAAADRTASVTPPSPAPPVVQPPPAGNPPPADGGDASAAQTAIDAAMRHLGVPYAWGGGGTRGPGWGWGPDLGVFGFDCSGLTQYAYAQAGISIPRNSRAQYAALPKVSSDDLRPGDLVFWASDPSQPSTIYHVAIYLGDGKMVEAPQSGDVVKVSSMRWGGYAGAVRPSA